MRSVAILTGPFTHLDHLGVLSSLLHIPLIVTDPATYALANEWYPDIDVHLLDTNDLSMSYLAENFDLIFETGKFLAQEMDLSLRFFSQKKMHFVFCPHGNSDKGHSLKIHPQQEFHLVYGNHLYDLLQKTGALGRAKKIFKTGNYRWDYFQKHFVFYQNLIQKRLSYLQKHQSIILYAPTWSDQENTSSFLESTEQLINELSGQFNLLIKLHPFLIEDHPATFYRILAKYEKHPSVLFITDIPVIYPLLAQSVAYIGDYSSIGYDALKFDLPLYFLKTDSSFSPLHNCGLICPKKNLNDFILKTLYTKQVKLAEKRKAAYQYAFEEFVNLDALKRSIFSACATTNEESPQPTTLKQTTRL